MEKSEYRSPRLSEEEIQAQATFETAKMTDPRKAYLWQAVQQAFSGQMRENQRFIEETRKEGMNALIVPWTRIRGQQREYTLRCDGQNGISWFDEDWEIPRTVTIREDYPESDWDHRGRLRREGSRSRTLVIGSDGHCQLKIDELRPDEGWDGYFKTKYHIGTYEEGSPEIEDCLDQIAADLA